MYLKNICLFWTIILVCVVRTLNGECNRKTAITSVLNGTITLGQETKYPENTHCEWLIKAPLPGQHIKLIFHKFDTECGFDFLKIYDGSTTSRILLATFSGDTVPPVVQSNMSSVLLNFFSDNNYSRSGWIIEFRISNCSGSCSGHGTCIGHKCSCDELYTGESCEIEVCPEMCNNITGQGECSKFSGKCICNSGYIGQSCSYSPQESPAVETWHVINEKSSVFTARFGHAGVYVKEMNSFWVFGGSDLNVYFDDLIKFDFITNKWLPLTPPGTSPSARFRHTLELYKDTLILFGGELSNGTFMNDLWSFNMSILAWTLLPGNGSESPPGLASHTANVVDDELFIFGGRSMEHGISYEMYKYDLTLVNGWTRVIYKLSKNSDLRLAGHTSVYYPALESLVIFGGIKQLTGRANVKRNSIHMYHLKHNVWMEIEALIRNESYVPEPRAFHSSVAIGDYMVVYGGNVHKHNTNEKCFANNVFLFNLKTFTWVSPSLLFALGSPGGGVSRQPKRGRFLSVAVVFNNNTLLLAGGYNGVANGDLLAIQFPSNIASGNLKDLNESGIYCGLYNENNCGADPSCIWCSHPLGCLSVVNKETCSVKLSSSTPRLCHLFRQCSSCLTWGTLPGLHCGWCVQDSRCYPQMFPSGACSPKTEKNAYALRGWWGDTGSFLKSIVECRVEDNPPGLVSSWSFEKSHKRYSDVVSIVNPIRVQLSNIPVLLNLSPDLSILKLTGFIYPFLSLPINNNVRIQLMISTGSASVRLSTNEDHSGLAKVISVKDQNGGATWSNLANRTGGLFPDATVNKRYYMEIKTEFTQPGHISVFINDELVNGSFVRPFFSNNCSSYGDCFECLSDMSCGWCSSTNTCILRNSSAVCFHSSGEILYLVLNTTFCETCAQHVDCNDCLNDRNCAWDGRHFCHNLNGDEFRGKSCQASCNSVNDCTSCVSNYQCLWCGNSQKCIPWFSYLPDSLHGTCSHWSDWSTESGKCSDCSKHQKCSDCHNERFCGWCGEYHNGKCFSGGFEGPTNGQCQHLMPVTEPTTNSSLWSYTSCPDENECITRRDCHQNATCINYPGGYDCKCDFGFVGDGFQCNISCVPSCVNGICSAHLTCDCDLGWTGNVCSINCGCNNHSTCNSGVGQCDKCQDFTYGEHCEFCVRGSYGDATSSIGCTKCSCNGHGNEARGTCDLITGDCYCMNNTKGKHCDQCLEPGLVGRPERGGGCYYPCKAHSVLSNVTEGSISSSDGTISGIEDTNCVWIITTEKNGSQYIVYSNEKAPGTITFRIKDIQVDCQTEHVYLYDGFPPYNLENFSTASTSSFNLMGSLCGFDASNIPSVETQTGTIVVVFKANASRSFFSGFNGTFVVNRCPDFCVGNRYCFNNGSHEKCVCKEGWSGHGCDEMLCSANCSQGLSQGYCNQDRSLCGCTKEFSGETCEVNDQRGSFVWELLSNINGRTSRLPRMAHTMVADDILQSLVIYGGYSYKYGILGDIWVYHIIQESFIQLAPAVVIPSPRYLHATAIYKRHMYTSGGTTKTGVSSELWAFNLDTKQWSTQKDLPRRLAGHTLNVVGDTMYLIGGYNPLEYCSSKVYSLKLIPNSVWVDLKQIGDIFKPCFGHTTVYDKHSHSLIVFGKEATKVSAKVAVLNLAENKWTVMPELQSFSRSFHVSIMIGNVTMLLGGYIYNSNYAGITLQDFATEVLVYDIKCNQWKNIDAKGKFPKGLAYSSTASIGNEVYLFGGYNGISSDELFRLNVSSDWCSMFVTQHSCLNSLGCNWCKNKTLNQSFCFSKDTNRSVTCLNSTNTEYDCSMLPRAQSLSSEILSWSDNCDKYSSCSSCIQAKDGYGNPASCFWAIDLGQCMSLYVQPIVCAFGICGRMLRNNDICPGKCNRTRYCSDCLEQYNCGWCTNPRENGAGICLEGTFTGPHNATCQNNVGPPPSERVWVSSVCLLENECENGNHLCNENETCIDQSDKYVCQCKSGYQRSNGSHECAPVCSQGCLHGNCIDPDVCFCSSGWVGSNCSVGCQCHDKGNCVDENQLDNCTDCRDNTTGRSCERCLPNFIGENGICKTCYEKCYSNAKKCYIKNNSKLTNQDLQEINRYGPKSLDDYVCDCEDDSAGKHCSTCKDGYYKLRKEWKCKKCQCRGHGNKCSPSTGLDCNCKNNTQATPGCLSSGVQTGKNCHTNQCSACDASYTGDPENEGQQCYRTMRILQHFSLKREKSHSSHLFPSQTNFFYVHPSYTNADIRLTMDVFFGSIDVYVATSPGAFVVAVDQNVSDTSGSLSYLDWYTDGLNKYCTFEDYHQAAVVTDIDHKLVVTFPYEEHQLEDKRFYIIVKAGRSGADGIVYFKQDTSKIDLVVFFAVFFSCFFLLLSVLLITWTIKHRINSRQQVHNREVQRERLESRPFAQFSFLFEYQAPSPSIQPNRKTTNSSRKAIGAMSVQSTKDCLAAVSTVMIQLPQTEKTKMSLVLGTTLTLLTPQQLDKLAKPQPKFTDEIETEM